MAIPLLAIGALQGLSTATSVLTTLEQGKLNKATFEHNAKMAEFDAAYSKFVAETNENRLNEDAARLIGQTRAEAGASGFAVDGGTNDQVIADINRNVAIDAAAIRTQGAISSFKSMSAAAQASVDARNAIGQSRIQAATTILGDASSYARAYGLGK